MLAVLLFVGLCVAACFARVEAILKGIAWGLGALLLIGACAGVARADDCGGYRTAVGQDVCRLREAAERRAELRAAAARAAAAEHADEARRHELESRTGADAVRALSGPLPAGGLGETNLRPAEGAEAEELAELRRQAGIQ